MLTHDKAADELLTPPEAAVVADVSIREINRVFDEPILPKRLVRQKGGRRLSFEGCAFVSFYFQTAARLTADQRSRAIRAVAARKRSGADGAIYSDDVLTLNFERFFTETAARHEALRGAREAVVQDPGILGGTPVLRGTRIPVHDVAATVRAGGSVERLRAAYPNLDERLIELARIYADANPVRGRPRTLRDVHPELEQTSEQRVPRRRRG